MFRRRAKAAAIGLSAAANLSQAQKTSDRHEPTVSWQRLVYLFACRVFETLAVFRAANHNSFREDFLKRPGVALEWFSGSPTVL